EDLFTGLEIRLGGWCEGDYSNVRRHFEGFFTVLVFQNECLCVAASDFVRNRRICHCTLGQEIPRAMALASPAHRFGKDMDFHRLLCAIRLWHCRNADEGAGPDVTQGRFDDGAYRCAFSELYFQSFAAARFYI